MPRRLLPKLRNRTQTEEPYERPSLDPSDSASIVSIASDATAPNNPGPGRNVGRLYDALGSRLERLLTKRASRASHTPQSFQLVPLGRQFESASTESIASDATSPNNPGPGRNLGLFLDKYGKRFERFANRTAGHFRLGPQPVVEEIRGICRGREKRLGTFWHLNILDKLAHTDREYTILKKRCQKLLKYCR